MFQNQMHVNNIYNNIYKLYDYEAEADLYVGFSKHGFSVCVPLIVLEFTV